MAELQQDVEPLNKVCRQSNGFSLSRLAHIPEGHIADPRQPKDQEQQQQHQVLVDSKHAYSSKSPLIGLQVEVRSI